MCKASGCLVWFPVRCRDCAGCRTAHRLQVRKRIEYGIANSSGSVAMLTLTSLPGTDWPQVMRSWTALRRWLRAEGWTGGYAAVKEQGSGTGMRHLHIICTGWRYVDQAVLSARWARVSGAKVVDVRAVRSREAGRAAAYVSKYVSKAVGQGDTRKRVTFSKGWPREDVRSEWVWQGELDAWTPLPRTYKAVGSTGALVEHHVEGCACLGRLWAVEAAIGYLLRLSRRGRAPARPIPEAPF